MQVIAKKHVWIVRFWSLVILAVLVLPDVAFSQAEPKRIVSTSPSITEDLFAIGLGARVVGVSNYCEYPDQVRDLPKVGTFLRPDPELIARLRPDLVLVHKLPNNLANRLIALHIPFAEIDQGGLEDTYSEIRQIGDATGAKAQAEELIRKLRSRLDHIQAQAISEKTPRVVVLIGKESGALSNLVAVGRDGFINELLRVAGAKNVIAEQSPQAYPRISLETILRLDPDVIIDMGDMGNSPEERKRKAVENENLWRNISKLNAVRNGRVYCLASSAFVVPGPRIVEAAGIFFSILHGKNPQ